VEIFDNNNMAASINLQRRMENIMAKKKLDVQNATQKTE
jgi:hypothetical protein